MRERFICVSFSTPFSWPFPSSCSSSRCAEVSAAAVVHLNMGSDLLAIPLPEAARLRELNLEVGRQAKSSAAYGHAAGHLRTALTLIERLKGSEYAADAKVENHTLGDLAECEFMASNNDRAEELFQRAWDIAPTKYEAYRSGIAHMHVLEASAKLVGCAQVCTAGWGCRRVATVSLRIIPTHVVGILGDRLRNTHHVDFLAI